MSIRIAIADDHPLVITGFASMLQDCPDIELTGTYLNGDELLAGLQQHEVPDVLLLDIQMPGKTGEELVPLLISQYPTLRILTLTNFDSVLYVSNMLAHGVHGYILKTSGNDLLIEAIKTVYREEQFVDPQMRQKLSQVAQKVDKRLSLKSTLTNREKEILQLIVDGCTSNEIAEKLFLSIRTINTYRLQIMLKLDVTNAAALVSKALRSGLAE